MKELVIACCRVAQKNPNLVIDEQSKEYWRWRDTILHNEDLLLEAICFDLSLEPPYKTLFDFLNYFGEQDNKKLRNAGWAFLNDSNLTMLCLLFPSRTIAAAALYCGAKHCDVAFVDRGCKAWWDIVGVELRDIRRACNYMASVYENSPLKHSENIYSRTPEDGDPLFARTRARASPLPSSPLPEPDHANTIDKADSENGDVPERSQASAKRSREQDTNGQDAGGIQSASNGVDPASHPSQDPPPDPSDFQDRKRARLDGAPNGSAAPPENEAPDDQVSEEGELES